jgi:hypothetical protein
MSTLALLAAASAYGQQVLRVDIPFEFSVANSVMPAGHYDVIGTPNMLKIYNYASRNSVLVTTNNIGGGSNESADSRLVFNRYGDKYFLAEVWATPGSPQGSGVIKSKAEREAASANPDVARVTVPVRTGSVTLASLR